MESRLAKIVHTFKALDPLAADRWRRSLARAVEVPDGDARSTLYDILLYVTADQPLPQTSFFIISALARSTAPQLAAFAFVQNVTLQDPLVDFNSNTLATALATAHNGPDHTAGVLKTLPHFSRHRISRAASRRPFELSGSAQTPPP